MCTGASWLVYSLSSEIMFAFIVLFNDTHLFLFLGVPGVLSVQPDKDFESENKDYGGLSLSC